MPRSIELSVSPDKTAALLDRVAGLDGVVGIALQRGASLRPAGDVLTIRATNDGCRSVFRVLSELDILAEGSVVTSEPYCLVSSQGQGSLEHESNEAGWEEMASMLRRETNPSNNFMLLMFLAGGIAAGGLWTNTLHLVIGAMTIAPGFEPLLRMPFGLITGMGGIVRYGATGTVIGYGLLALGGAIALLVLRAVDAGGPADLEANSWVRYWTSVSPTGVVVALLAGAAGAAVVSIYRSVLSVGVMIALALIPTMSLTGMALAEGDLPLAGAAAVRWLVDVICVLGASTAVLAAKQAFIHRRASLG